MKTILVVDDEFGNAEVLGLILEEEGYRVFCAANGREGMDRVRDVPPDLVIMDFMMPIMTGAEMAKQLRASSQTRHIKIVMHTGLSEAAVREHFADYDAFLRKPYNVEAALGVISDLLSGKPPERFRNM